MLETNTTIFNPVSIRFIADIRSIRPKITAIRAKKGAGIFVKNDPIDYPVTPELSRLLVTDLSFFVFSDLVENVPDIVPDLLATGFDFKSAFEGC